MRLLVTLFLAAGFGLCGSARAETFTSNWKVQEAQAWALQIVKCRMETKAGQAGRNQCVRSTFREEVEKAGQEPIVRYVQTALEADEGGEYVRIPVISADNPLILELKTNEHGAPTALVNRKQVFGAQLLAILGDAGGSTSQAIKLLEGMDDQALGRLFGRDFASLSFFQGGVQLEVGVPISTEGEAPFPLSPDITLKSIETYEIYKIDAKSGKAYGRFQTNWDPESLKSAISTFAQNVMQRVSADKVAELKIMFEKFEINNSSSGEVIIDIKTGATLGVDLKSYYRVRGAGQDISRQETLKITRAAE